jgi:hypothetical protein
MLLLALAMAAAMADTPATSQPATAPSSPAASIPAAADDSTKVICRREEVTGSHFERKVCMTRADWDRQSQQAQLLEQQLHESAATNGGSAPPT